MDPISSPALRGPLGWPRRGVPSTIRRIVADWSPSRYLRFEDERTRAASDLLAQVRAANVRQAVDLGCGPGNSTELLALRFPQAQLIGIDNSPAMVAEARRRLPQARFELADAADWTPRYRGRSGVRQRPLPVDSGSSRAAASCAGSAQARSDPRGSDAGQPRRADPSPDDRGGRIGALESASDECRARPATAGAALLRGAQALGLATRPVAHELSSSARRRCGHCRIRPQHGSAAFSRSTFGRRTRRFPRPLYRTKSQRLIRRWSTAPCCSPFRVCSSSPNAAMDPESRARSRQGSVRVRVDQSRRGTRAAPSRRPGLPPRD